MKMKLIAVPVGVALVLAGCNPGTSGGPGATEPATKTSILGQAEDTFSLGLSGTTIRRGETKSLTIEINRGENFAEDVLLEFKDLPIGITLGPGSLLVTSGEANATVELVAASDAPLGEYTVHLSGHPTRGADAVTAMQLTVVPPDMSSAQTDLDAYRAAMETELALYQEKFQSLQQAAAEAQGEAKTALDLKVTNAKTKLDAAVVRVNELKAANAEQWENVREDVNVAFSDLRKQFN